MMLATFLFLSVFAVKNVLSLSCYATDLAAIAHGDLKTTIQDCRENLDQLAKMQKQSFQVPSDVRLRCYQVVAKTDSASTAIKGCIPEKGCEALKPLFKFMLQMGKATDLDVDCYECDGDRCNTASRRNIFGFAVIALLVFLIL